MDTRAQAIEKQLEKLRTPLETLYAATIKDLAAIDEERKQLAASARRLEAQLRGFDPEFQAQRPEALAQAHRRGAGNNSRGDKPPTGFVSEERKQAVVDWLKTQDEPRYVKEIAKGVGITPGNADRVVTHLRFEERIRVARKGHKGARMWAVMKGEAPAKNNGAKAPTFYQAKNRHLVEPIRALLRKNGGEMMQADIGKKLKKGASDVSGALTIMEHEGEVSREFVNKNGNAHKNVKLLTKGA